MLGTEFRHAPSKCREQFIGLLCVLAGEVNARLTGVHPFTRRLLEALRLSFQIWLNQLNVQIPDQYQADGQKRKTYTADVLSMMPIFTHMVYVRT